MTITPLFAKAVAIALAQTPEANALIRWKHLYRRSGVGVFFQVALPGDEKGLADLSGFTLHDVERNAPVG